MTDDIVKTLRNRAKHCKEDLEQDVEAFVLRQAADEIERLRVWVKELFPFMANDVRQGLLLGREPFDITHCKDIDDKCPDCDWYATSLKWKQRIDGGEFNSLMATMYPDEIDRMFGDG